MNKLKQWQAKHGVSPDAMNDLSVILGLYISPVEVSWQKLPPKSEAAIQADVRLKSSRLGWRVWRNNVGVAVNATGVPVRYGLCNETKKMNQVIKSSDLIGIRPVTITPNMIGHIIGQFVALEVKRSDWFYTGTDREVAQLKFHQIVDNLGGYSKFINDMEHLGL